MSLLEKVVNSAFAGKAKHANPAELRKRIIDQNALVQQLDAKLAQASLEWACGAQGGSQTLDQLDAQLTMARRELRALEAAHTLAAEQEKLRERAELAALHVTQVNAVTSHLRARDRAAEALSKAIGEAAAAFETLHEKSAKAYAASPGGPINWPKGSKVGFGELRALVEQELFRLGHGARTNNGTGFGLRFPGGAVNDLRFVNSPEAIPSLVDELHSATEFTIATLKGKPAPSRPVPSNVQVQQTFPTADGHARVEALGTVNEVAPKDDLADVLAKPAKPTAGAVREVQPAASPTLRVEIDRRTGG